MNTIKSLKILTLGCFAIAFLASSCKEVKTTGAESSIAVIEKGDTKAPFFKLSLAQWSLHKAIFEEGMNPYDFAAKASELGFEGIEYVSALYDEELKQDNYSPEAMAAFVAKNNEEAKKYGVTNVLIMIDGQGDLATTSAMARKEAVENHFKWVDAAAAMNCSAIRVNLAGSKKADEWHANAVDGLTQLATYAKTKGINVLVENHGGLSSDASKLAAVMVAVNMTNCGTLPDFGNFCVQREDGSDYNGACGVEYDKYKGVAELMPHALAVSAKAYDFDAQGNETTLDYAKLLQTVKDAGYTGFIGVEYEGNVLSEKAGIVATKDLLVATAQKLK